MERFLRPFLAGVVLESRTHHLQPLPRPAVAVVRARRPSGCPRGACRRSASSSPRGSTRSACISGRRPGRCPGAVETGDGAAERTSSSWPPTRRPPRAASRPWTPSAPRSVTTHFHVLPESPWSSPLIVLGQPGGRLVNSVVLTDAQPRYSPDRRALVASSTLQQSAEADVRAEVARAHGVSAGRPRPPHDGQRPRRSARGAASAAAPPAPSISGTASSCAATTATPPPSRAPWPAERGRPAPCSGGCARRPTPSPGVA